jgi:hypothetical protein
VTVLLKLFYAAAVATLIVLVVAFGIRTAYEPPEAPQFPEFSRGSFAPIPAPGETPTPEQEEYIEAQERYQETYRDYEEDLERYRSIVLGLCALFGVAAIAGGVFLNPKLDALRLGLVAGGLFTLIYGVIQAEGDFDGLGAAAVFAIAGVGLVVILAAGYRWLDAREA